MNSTTYWTSPSCRASRSAPSGVGGSGARREGRGPLGAGGGKYCWRWGEGGVRMQRGCGSQPPSWGSLAVAALDRALPSLLGRS